MTVAIVGGGSWGTAMAIHLARLGLPTRLWVREPEILDGLHRQRVNRVFLPEFKVPSPVTFHADLADATRGAAVVFIAVPSLYCRGVYQQLAPHLGPGCLLVSLTKGIEEGTLKRMSQVLSEVLGLRLRPRIAVLSGPSFAREVAQGHPTAVVVASRDLDTARKVQRLVAGLTFRVYASSDMAGVEIAGAVKNVIAVAAGIADALAAGHNAKAALITRGVAEMTRLGVRNGARRKTFYGLAGMGDLVLTCTGVLSRNRQLGYELGLGRSLQDIVGGTAMVAEAVRTTLSVHDLAARQGVEMPIAEQVFQVLYRNKDPRRAITDLMSRRLKDE